MSSSIVSPKLNTHLFFCSESNCSNPVGQHDEMCIQCEASTVSSDCPGCGEDILVGANGYCCDCWQERFGQDDRDEPVSWYKPICEECDNAYATDTSCCDYCAHIKNKLKTKMTPAQKADWQRLLNKRKPALSPIRIPKPGCIECGSRTITCYRGDDPLCASCEEDAYGSSPSCCNQREMTGKCQECNYFYDMVCSEDSRTLCRPCQNMLREQRRYCNRCEGYYHLEKGHEERRECYDCDRHQAIMNPENVCEECGVESWAECDCSKIEVEEEERSPRGWCNC
jgi:hypothetical protein